MKYIIISLLISSSLFSNEIQRIEAIVNDISKLRTQYEECRVDLQKVSKKNNSITQVKCPTCENEKNKVVDLSNSLKEQNEKNLILSAKIDSMSIASLNIEDSKYSDIKKEILNYKQLLVKKDLEIKKLKNSLKKQKCKVKIVTKTIREKLEDTNPFPTLVPKDGNIDNQNVKVTKAGTFRLIKDAKIYDSINGKLIYNWEKDRSFTSNKETKDWIKITGSFVNKQWQSTDKNLWILKSRCLKR